MRTKTYLGIDPGKTGAIASLVRDAGTPRVWVVDMPSTTKDVIDILRRAVLGISMYEGPLVVILEKQQAMPKQGVVSMFNLGQHYGELRGAIMTLRIPLRIVRPIEWKRHFRLGGKDKEASRALAQERWPEAPLGRKKDHGRAEALLLAQYGLDTE